MSSVRSLMQVCSSLFHAITQLSRCHHGGATGHHRISYIQRDSRDVMGNAVLRSLVQVCSSSFHAITQLSRCHLGALPKNIINKENQEM